MTTVFSHLTDRCSFIGFERLWLSFKTIKPQVESYYIRFMVLMDGFHCDHSCNDLDNSIIPHVNSAVIWKYIRMLQSLTVTWELRVEASSHLSYANHQQWSRYVKYIMNTLKWHSLIFKNIITFKCNSIWVSERFSL